MEVFLRHVDFDQFSFSALIHSITQDEWHLCCQICVWWIHQARRTPETRRVLQRINQRSVAGHRDSNRLCCFKCHLLTQMRYFFKEKLWHIVSTILQTKSIDHSNMKVMSNFLSGESVHNDETFQLFKLSFSFHLFQSVVELVWRKIENSSNFIDFDVKKVRLISWARSIFN